MEWHDMMVDGYGRIMEILERVLNGLAGLAPDACTG
jgi:hypothetical protein